MRADLVLRAPRVLLPDGERPAALVVRDGVIVAVAPVDADLTAARDVRHGPDVVLLPGLVDTHVHLQDPGHEDWEGFPAGTRAAAAGGVTTLLDMPVDARPATVDAAALAAKVAAAHGRCHVDVGFWGGLTPANGHHLGDLAAGGVFGFKAFLVPPGLPDFPALPIAQLPAAATAAADHGLPLLVHAEHPHVLAEHAAAHPALPGPLTRYPDLLARHPAAAESEAVAAVIAAARQVQGSGARLHVVHVSTAEAADLIAVARAEGLPVTGETCPHLLCLAAEEVPDGGVEFVVGPPLRGAANAERLWRHVAAGTLGMVVSDHSPTGPKPPADLATAPPGIAGLELTLPLLWTAARARGASLADVARWTSTAPAAFAGLHRKGLLAPGRDADVTVLAPDEPVEVRDDALHTRQRPSPYTGRRLTGAVRETWLRGRRVHPPDHDHGPHGRLLTAPQSPTGGPIR